MGKRKIDKKLSEDYLEIRGFWKSPLLSQLSKKGFRTQYTGSNPTSDFLPPEIAIGIVAKLKIRPVIGIIKT